VRNTKKDTRGGTAQTEKLCKAASQGDKEAQFQLGKNYLINHQLPEAERWLRYAANQGHYEAYRSLVLGTRNHYFSTTSRHIHIFAIDILKKLVRPNPTKHQIAELEQLLTYHLNTEFHLMKPIQES
jgi:TPR repeat protein